MKLLRVLPALVLLLAAIPSARAALSAETQAEVQAQVMAHLEELEGFDENVAWLKRLPIHWDDFAGKLAAAYEPPKQDGEPGEMDVDTGIVERTIQALAIQGVPQERRASLAAWVLLPTVLHESQHAIQLAALSRNGAMRDFHTVEAEIDAEAVAARAALQIMDKHPEAFFYTSPLKTQVNFTVNSWRDGVEKFKQDIAELYRPRMTPSIHDPGGPFGAMRDAIRSQIAELEEEIPGTKDEHDRQLMEDMLKSLKEQQAAVAEPALEKATVGYFQEREAAVGAAWENWAKTDVERNAASAAAPAERGRLALASAARLALISPTYFSPSIERQLAAAAEAASETGDAALARQVSEFAARYREQRFQYALAIYRVHRAQDAPDKLEKNETELLDFLKKILPPADYRRFTSAVG